MKNFVALIKVNYFYYLKISYPKGRVKKELNLIV